MVGVLGSTSGYPRSAPPVRSENLVVCRLAQVGSKIRFFPATPPPPCVPQCRPGLPATSVECPPRPAVQPVRGRHTTTALPSALHPPDPSPPCLHSRSTGTDVYVVSRVSRSHALPQKKIKRRDDFFVTRIYRKKKLHDLPQKKIPPCDDFFLHAFTAKIKNYTILPQRSNYQFY